MNQRRNPDPPLYYLVPSRPDQAIVTLPLREKILHEVARDYLSGKIDYRLSKELIRRYDNPRLNTMTEPLGEREIWGIDHPALKSKINSNWLDPI